jgi:hypothetical protein
VEELYRDSIASMWDNPSPSGDGQGAGIPAPGERQGEGRNLFSPAPFLPFYSFESVASLPGIYAAA